MCLCAFVSGVNQPVATAGQRLTTQPNCASHKTGRRWLGQHGQHGPVGGDTIAVRSVFVRRRPLLATRDKQLGDGFVTQLTALMRRADEPAASAAAGCSSLAERAARGPEIHRPAGTAGRPVWRLCRGRCRWSRRGYRRSQPVGSTRAGAGLYTRTGEAPPDSTAPHLTRQPHT